MKDKKKILIGILIILIVVMSAGYALLAQELTIKGKTSIDFLWKVEITNITQKELVGGVTEKSKSYTATTANFDIGFTQPGDYVIYDIEVTNSGTLDAVISNINVVTDNNPAIIYITSGLKRGDTISKNGNKKYLTVKIEYDSNVTSQPVSNDNDITVQIDFQQDLGQVSPYEYVIGDKINFANSGWYVIKNSTYDEDYVTLIKETVLTNSELGEYAITFICPENLPYPGYSGCSAGGEIKNIDTMSYYWDENCHPVAYGYSSYSNNCYNKNIYATSKVKEMLETRYLPIIGATNLKEVDNYKIRLITLEELQQNLGVSTIINQSWYDASTENSLSWVYQNFGDQNKNVYGYWTMTSVPDYSSYSWYVRSDGHVELEGVNYMDNGVRPVINLLKSAIE